MKCAGRLFNLLLIAFSVACSSPAEKMHLKAEQLGMDTLALSGESYKLTAFYKPAQTDSKILHVYLEGDGRPWLRGVWPASEPTTRDALMLSLLAIDETPALYLARPCYNGHAADDGCDSRLWTSARYSEQVVNAMTAALGNFCQTYQCSKIVLIGHSGGGTLAMLMAARLPLVQGVVTVAGNYDIDVWADHHGYLRLNESLNPARQNSTHVEEWHFLGGQDTNIPPELFMTALQQRRHSQVTVFPSVSHQKGWLEVWPQILKTVQKK